MVNLKIFLKAFFEMLIDISARFLLPMLIWCGAVISLANSENGFLALILVFSGIAWTYRELPGYIGNFALVKEGIENND